MSSNLYTDINEFMFTKLVCLTHLILSHNSINHLKAGVFDALTSLEVLNVSSNELVSIETGTFQKLINLNYLDISENQLVNIEPDVFVKLCHLEHLNVSKNSLPHFDVLMDDMISLNYLNISQNQILSLKDTMLVYSPELKYFECSQNKISSLGFLTNFRPFMRYKGNNFEKSVCTFDLNKNGFIKQLDLNVIMNIDFFKSLQIDFSKVESFDLDRYTSKNIIRSNLNKETLFIKENPDLVISILVQLLAREELFVVLKCFNEKVLQNCTDCLMDTVISRIINKFTPRMCPKGILYLFNDYKDHLRRDALLDSIIQQYDDSSQKFAFTNEVLKKIDVKLK